MRQANLFLGLEFVGGGDLFALLEKAPAGRLGPEATRFYSAEVVLAIDHLHQNNIIYRDLKPENVMVALDGHIMLTDFGFSKEIAIGSSEKTRSMLGTPAYLAPETMTGNGYSSSVDWWAVGCLIFEMLVGGSPFGDEDDDPASLHRLLKAIMAAAPEVPAWVESKCPSVAALLRGFLTHTIPERLGCGPLGTEEIKTHAFYHGLLDWQVCERKELKPPESTRQDLLDDPDAGLSTPNRTPLVGHLSARGSNGVGARELLDRDFTPFLTDDEANESETALREVNKYC